ncbi:MAG: glycosyltransferase family 2 protein [Kiritimatiellae bacterium]|nr:glycosyltransferase family 2 protein [Kiritimatiellia bacterium]
MRPYLTICIPTYHRARFLREMLGTIARQLREGGWDAATVAVAVSDNGSPDETPQVIAEARQGGVPVESVRQPRNLGINPNLCAALEMARGRFAWLLGDDELLQPGAIRTVLDWLRRHDPGLLLLFDARYPRALPRPAVYSDYRSFAADCVRRDPAALTEHTLLSSNVVRVDCYDAAFARASLETDFPHMFGMIRGLRRTGAPVVVPDAPVIMTREDRPPPPDGRWVPIDRKWRDYLSWLRAELELPEIDPLAPTRLARRAMLGSIARDPWRFVRQHWRSAFRASAWRFLWDRLRLGRDR